MIKILWIQLLHPMLMVPGNKVVIFLDSQYFILLWSEYDFTLCVHSLPVPPWCDLYHVSCWCGDIYIPFLSVGLYLSIIGVVSQHFYDSSYVSVVWW